MWPLFPPTQAELLAKFYLYVFPFLFFCPFFLQNTKKKNFFVCFLCVFQFWIYSVRRELYIFSEEENLKVFYFRLANVARVVLCTAVFFGGRGGGGGEGGGFLCRRQERRVQSESWETETEPNRCDVNRCFVYF